MNYLEADSETIHTLYRDLCRYLKGDSDQNFDFDSSPSMTSLCWGIDVIEFKLLNIKTKKKFFFDITVTKLDGRESPKVLSVVKTEDHKPTSFSGDELEQLNLSIDMWTGPFSPTVVLGEDAHGTYSVLTKVNSSAADNFPETFKVREEQVCPSVEVFVAAQTLYKVTAERENTLADFDLRLLDLEGKLDEAIDQN